MIKRVDFRWMTTIYGRSILIPVKSVSRDIYILVDLSGGRHKVYWNTQGTGNSKELLYNGHSLKQAKRIAARYVKAGENNTQ